MSSPFVYNNSRLPFPKTDGGTLPPGANVDNYVSGTEWNNLCQAGIDLRSAIISGSYIGFITSSTSPNVQIGLSGTVVSIWVSSSFLPQLSTTSSNGFNSRPICLAPTGSYTVSGVWRTVWVDPQGVVISGSTVGDLAAVTTASVDFLTRDLTVQRDEYVSGTSNLFMITGSSALITNVNSTYVTSSLGIKTVDFASTRNSSFVNLTASAGALFSFDTTIIRNLTVNGNSSFVSLTGSGGGNLLDLEVTRNSTLTNLTASAGIKTSLDLESSRNLLVAGSISGTFARFSNEVFGSPLIQLNKTSPSDPGRFISFQSASVEWGSLNMTNTTSSLEQIQLNLQASKYFEIIGQGTRLFNVGATGITIGAGLGVNAGGGNWSSLGNIDTCVNLTGSASIKAGLDLEGVRNLVHSNASGKIGLYGNIPVARPSAYTMNAGITYRTMPSGSTVGQVEGTLRQLIDDLINVGIVTGTI